MSGRYLAHFLSAAGAASHSATGALTADAATVSGAAAHLALHSSSGALSAQAATLAGTAAHLTLHTSSGSLVADAATVAGSAALSSAGAFSSTGALSADAATLSGTAVHYTLHTATGAIAADAATVAGTAQHLTLHTATGDLIAGSATVAGAAVHSGDGATVDEPAIVGGGGWAWAAPRRSRYSYLPRETREQMAERVRKQREALGILLKRVQKRVEIAAAKEARRADPSLAPLAPVAVEIAQDTGIALQTVADAIQAVFENERGLVLARIQADAARGAELRRQDEEKQRVAAEVAQREWRKRLQTLIAEDDKLLMQDESARQQAIETIRQTQKALLALLA